MATKEQIKYLMDMNDDELNAFIKHHKRDMEYYDDRVKYEQKVYDQEKKESKRIRKNGDAYQEKLIAKNQKWYEQEKEAYDVAVEVKEQRQASTGSSSSRGIGSTKSSATGK